MSSVMESLLQKGKLNQFKSGSIIKGIITEVREKEVRVDIGAKSEGVIPSNEFPDADILQIGSEIEVYLDKLENKEGNPVISYDKARQKKNWDDILNKHQEGSIVSGRIKGKVRGGLVVDIGVDAFLPGSQIDVQQPKNLDQYLGQTHDYKIIKINTGRKNIVLSRRELIDEQKQQKRKHLLSKISVGSICKGVVKNITDYGAFIDLDGLDGLLHITDLSWGRVSHTSEVLKVGETITVKVIGIDLERERISLGLKQTQHNPWDDIETKYPIDSKVVGKVVNFMPQGAFISLEEGVEAFMYIGELSWTKRYNKPSDLLKIGQEIEAIVTNIKKDEKRIGLSLRRLETNPWEMIKHNYPIGARVRGKVQRIENSRVFINLEEGIDGIIKISDISWTRKIDDPRQLFTVDQEIDAIVLSVDLDRQSIFLGVKQLQEDPWGDIDRYFKLFDTVVGKVIKVAAFGAFVELDHGFEGLVPMSHISDEPVTTIRETIKVGQEVTARIIKIDREERRIGLSIKATKYNSDQLVSEAASYDQLKRDRDFNNLGSLLDEVTR